MHRLAVCISAVPTVLVGLLVAPAAKPSHVAAATLQLEHRRDLLG